ncbi:MAG TPA: glycosyl hydrolase, partial [Actinopolymorphaceae bacterium]
MAPPSLRGWWRHVRVRAHESLLGRAAALGKAAALIGFGNSVRALRYAVHRARLDARALPRLRTAEHPPVGEPEHPGPAGPAEVVPGGVRIAFGDRHRLELRFLAAGGVFVGWDGAGPVPSYALAEEREPTWHTDVRLDPGEWPGTWTVAGGDLVVDVDASGSLEFRLEGHAAPFRRDDPPAWHGEAWSHRSALTEEAVVLGLGGRSTDSDRRPGTYRLWNTEPGGTYAKGDDPLSLTMPLYLVADDAACHLAF